ncbi:tumor necrosis factor receptor superfamily member 11A isoform X1 [Trichosurus vulpecula]|uniref:tumor necrosis factor receptor superfamily member 11A isoform X1 n=1 Tax=Trichosurus vulpecula TaxID=9337 RepID=UPI00186B2ABC|nr:tumor necrosis factor receptor superfamily member 11A isoform X1 [Trichosurus vulpecula]
MAPSCRWRPLHRLLQLLALCVLLGQLQLTLQITPRCNSEKHYEHEGRCCTKCDPGKYMSEKCTATSESICLPCGPDEYLHTWNEEDKCLLHKVCDSGKGLKVVHPGNQTFPRQCACTPGYHWSDDFDSCLRNGKCGPGFEAENPLQPNNDPGCKPCLVGYFSDAFSSNKCKSWTNCSNLGMVEKIPGTDKSDVVCDPLPSEKPKHESPKYLHSVIFLLLLACLAVITVIIFGIYYRREGKALTAHLWLWINDTCSILRRNKESSGDNFTHTPMTTSSTSQACEDVLLLTPEEKMLPEDSCYPQGHVVCGEADSCKVEDTAIVSLVNETEEDNFRQIPTEDEYVDRAPHDSDCLLLLSRPGSKPASPFSEPLEVGENDSLSQCFTGTESTIDSESSYCTKSSCRTDSIHISSELYLQKSFHCNDSNLAKEVESSDRNHWAANLDLTNGFEGCKEPLRKYTEASEKKADHIIASFENGPFPQCTCGSDLPPESQNILASDAEGEDLSFEETEVKFPNTKRGSSGSGGTSSDPPLASGNVTGNSNSTFISSGQVMNFKGDIIVVYVSQNSQEGPTIPGTSGENVGSPVQEENLNRCDTFAGNDLNFKEKCAESSLGNFSEDKAQNFLREHTRRSGPRIQEETQYGPHKETNQSTASQPVQEEGRPKSRFLKAWQ